MHILLIEDDLLIAQAIKTSLTDEGYEVKHAADGREALMLLSTDSFEFVLLDLGLPGIDGISILHTLRQVSDPSKKNTPVIIISARDSLEDRLQGLDVGADDYLVKPFHMKELLARMRAVLRRKTSTQETTLSNGHLCLDLLTKTVSIKDGPKDISLSRREYELLVALLTRPGAILSKRLLEQRIYAAGEEPDSLSLIHI